MSSGIDTGTASRRYRRAASAGARVGAAGRGRTAAAVATVLASLVAGCGRGPATTFAGGPVGEPAPVPVPEWPPSLADAALTERGRFVLTSGPDTVAVEEYRHGDAAFGSVLRLRGGATVRTVAGVGRDGRIPDLSIRVWPAGGPAGGAAGPLEIDIAFAGGSVAVRRAAAGAGSVRERRDVPPGTLPWTNPSVALLELVVRRARVAGIGAVPLYDAVGGGHVLQATVGAVAPDSVVVALPAAEFRLAVDGAGRIAGGVETRAGLVIHRDPAEAR